jgi:hypothetical protein
MNSLMNINSLEGVMSELDLFTVPVTNTQIESGVYVYYQPLAPVDNADVIEYVVPGSDDYIDLSKTVWEIKGKLLMDDGTDVPAAKDLATPANNFLHSLIQQGDAYLNDFQVTKGNQTYAYKAYIEKLLNFNKDYKETALSTCLWSTDTTARFNDLGVVAASHNNGGKRRRAYLTGSKTVEMSDKLHMDIFNVNKYLINNVTLKIKLTRTPARFYLVRTPEATLAAADHNYKFKITEAVLKIRKIKVSSATQLAHNRVLTNLKSAKYHINHSDIKHLAVVAGTTVCNWDNVFLGSIPTRIIIGFIKAAAMEGSYSENPYMFSHYSVNFLALYVDGISFPSKPYVLDYANDLYLRSYLDFLEGCSKWGNNKSNGISRTDYKGGNTFYVFDMTSDLSGASDHFNLVKQGSVRLEVHFAAALPENVNILIYGESEHVMLIDSNRTVAVDYK